MFDTVQQFIREGNYCDKFHAYQNKILL